MRNWLYSLMFMLPGIVPGMAQAEPARAMTQAHLARVTSDTCLLAGQRIRINGEGLRSERGYRLELFIGSRPLVLKTEQWNNKTITAVLPGPLKITDDQAVLAIRDGRTGNIASNRLVIRFCPKAEERKPDEPVQPSSELRAESTSRMKRPEGEARVLLPEDRPAPIVAASDHTDIVAGEVIVFSQDMNSARRLDDLIRQFDYRIKRRRSLKQLGMVMSVIRLPEGVTTKDAMEQLQGVDQSLVYDANHRYRLMGDMNEANAVRQLVKWGEITPHCGKNIRLGLIDTLVDTDHQSLPDKQIVTRSFLPLGVKAAEKRHATAIASILIGNPDPGGGIRGLLPGAHLYNAGIFRREAGGQTDTTAELVITALDWLQGQGVSVINLSLAGKSNRLLQWTIRQLIEKDQLLAAAAGNTGPDGAPAYPAAWPGVVAVTAVDIQSRVYRYANRGEYIDLAAPGVDVWAARPGVKGAYHSGTSFAVPFVTAALAVLRQRENNLDNLQLVQRLRQQVTDLGAPGHDPVYGYGLLQMNGGCK